MMTISGTEVEAIIVIGKDNEVLATISDSEIVEKDGISVIVEQS